MEVFEDKDLRGLEGTAKFFRVSVPTLRSWVENGFKARDILASIEDSAPGEPVEASAGG